MNDNQQPRHPDRNAELRRMLNDRRRQMQAEVQTRMQDVRAERASGGAIDENENAGTGLSDDLELALIQMKAGTLRRVDEALVRLDAGEYGFCFECHSEISEKRLRALPFAVRCTACEERLEQGEERTRQAAGKHAPPSLFVGGSGY